MMVSAVVLSMLILSIIPGLLEKGFISLPDNLPPMIDPRVPQDMEGMKAQLGSQVEGNWSLVVITLLSLVLNIFGEEFLWRGYVLPRQELTYGKNAWIVHGILWTLLHAFKWWQIPALLGGALALSFVAQRRKNTWPGIVAHFVTNGIGLLVVTLLVLGFST